MDWIALAALMVSIIALITSTTVAYQNWQHNKKSVLPSIGISRNFVSGDFHIILESLGVGPAIVERVEVTVDEQVFNLSSHLENHKFQDAYEYKYVGKSMVMGDGKFMPPNTSRRLLEFKNDSPEDIALFMSRLSFKVMFKSIYGEEFEEPFPSVEEDFKEEIQGEQALLKQP